MSHEFVRVTLPTAPLNCHSITLQPVPIGADLAKQIKELVELVEYRPGVMSERWRSVPIGGPITVGC